MKKSKQATALQRVDGVDRVSDLPDPILHLILAGLPTTEEIIRTSVLSRRWRYLWTSVPRVDIDYSRGLNSKQISGSKYSEEEILKFTEFVNWVLLNRTLDLDSVRLCCSNSYSMSTVERWIHAAVTRNVKQLHLVCRPTNQFAIEFEKFEMPHCLVTCCSLEVLRLSLMKGSLSLPNFTGFPSLRVLELSRVVLLDDDIVKSFFKSCPLLEDLSLIDCLLEELEYLCISCLELKKLRIDNRVMLKFGVSDGCSDLQICCPKLVYLELRGPVAHNFIFDSLDSLKKAVVHPHIQTYGRHMDYTICELFARISHVEYLLISLSFALKCIDPEVDVPVSLPNLKTLELTIDSGLIEDDSFTPKCWKLNTAATEKIFTQQLKKVVFTRFNGDKWALDIACFFMEHGKALEEIVFIWRDITMFNERSTETMDQVSKFHKASSNVKLISLL